MNPPVAPASAPRKKFSFRRFFVLVGIVVLSVLVLTLGVSLFFQDTITQQVVASVGKSLKTKLEVADAELSLFSGFPDASVDLRGVRLRDLGGANLLEAEKVSFRFALSSLFGSSIRVKSVVCADGAMRLRTDRSGRVLYDISKDEPAGKKQPAPTESELAIALENAEFQGVALLYENLQTRQSAHVSIEKAVFAGNFSAKKFNLTSSAAFTIDHFEVDSSRYLTGEKVRYDAVAAVDMSQDIYNLQGVELALGGNTFAVDGLVVNKPDYTDFNLKLTSQEGDISMVFNLLPSPYHDYFADFESTGTYSCAGTVKGRMAKNQHPTVAFSVSLRDGKVSSDKLQSPIRDVNFKATYTARPDGSGNFDITNFRGAFGGQPLNFDLKISNLDDPQVDFKFNGALPLDAAYGLFDMPEITGGDGLVRVNSLTINGKYADMTSMRRAANVQAAGEIAFDDAELTYNKVPVRFKTGTLRLQDNVFTLAQLAVQAGDSDFHLEGSAANLLPVLFADSLNSADAYLDFAAKMTAGNVDVDQILGMAAVQETVAEAGGKAKLDSLKTAAATERKSATDKLRGTFEATISQFNFEKIEGKNFVGKLAFDHNVLIINGDTEAMGGKIHVEADHHFEAKPYLKMRCSLRDIDLPTCLEQCNDFGQTVIQSKNIRGRLSRRVAAWAYWDEAGAFQLDKTRVLIDVSARDGELVGVQMFEEFSDYIHIQDLRRVKFTQLQNFLEISGGRFILPAMFIQTNAVNLTLSGTHTFEGKIDYKIKVNAGQVLFNKMKKHDNDLDPLPEKNGWLNLFYVIRGTLDKYDMKRSKKSVKADFEKGEARKNEIAAALNAAFESTPPVPPAPKLIGNQSNASDGEEYLDEIRGGEGQH
ncbi:MAG: AsmA-like C-terminal region-containing protein [Saprospiraceae bacterium]